MANRYFVPKFVTIEDRLAGLLTFKQLFALLAAFLFSFFVFNANQFLGFITALISFSTAIVLTFVYINGKPFLYILPSFFNFLFGNRKLVWQKIKKITYKEITLPQMTIEETKTIFPIIKSKKPGKPISDEKAEIILEYPETSIKEKITLSLKEPIALQTELIDHLIHRHLINPKNPYRFFPYIKLSKTLK